MASPNRLAQESSLYLRQHANNPVDWYPWGPEALTRAREFDRPIFLSIGYSACHWCHVMEHESFEAAGTAALMNKHFVCIKVDREERPDLDDIYMKAVQLLNRGQGGWPMSVWLTPELRPFYAGTYFPPDDRYGRPSFPRVLVALATAWRDRRDELAKSANEITDHLHDFGTLPVGEGTVVGNEFLRKAVQTISVTFDNAHGGFGGAPKFPHALELRLLLRAYSRFHDEGALAMVTKTLDKMARGGMYDQLGGGFHRYSVDAQWLVPHFEKMLYDNALLSVAYLEAFQATGNQFYCQIVEEILEYVQREMTCPGGAFYSTQDADSEGEEGKFFVWSRAEIDEILGKDDAEFASRVWGVTPEGNFDGHNILCRSKSDEQDAKLLRMSLEQFRDRLHGIRKRLLAVRSNRVWPGRDEKILTSWNGLMIAAFARAGAILERQDFIDSAIKAAKFIQEHLRTSDERLYRAASADGRAKLNGYLEDYAYYAEGLTHLFEATLDEKWLTEAAKFLHVMCDQFTDDDRGGFFTTSKDHEQLLLRIKDIHDGSTPSGNAMAVMALLRVSAMTGQPKLREIAGKTLTAFHGVMEAHPTAAGQMLIALDFDLGPVQEVSLAGNKNSEAYRRVLRAARQQFSPLRVLTPPGDRAADGPVSMYVCENQTCAPPVNNPEAAVTLLQSMNQAARDKA
jgi:uncharacterized protein